MCGNRIFSLPEEFGDLPRLELLVTIGNYPKLQVLYVPSRLKCVEFMCMEAMKHLFEGLVSRRIARVCFAQVSRTAK